MKLFTDRTQVIQLAEGEVCAVRWAKLRKLLGMHCFSPELRQEPPLLYDTQVLSTTTPCLSSACQCSRFHLLAIMQTPRSAHIMPGNPTSSTRAEESEAVIHYTIFSIFTLLPLGDLPKMEHCYEDNSCFSIFIWAPQWHCRHLKNSSST